MVSGESACALRARRRVLAGIGASCLAALLMSCSQRQPEQASPGGFDPVCVVRPAVDSAHGRAALSLLERLYPGALSVAMQDLPSALRHCLDEGWVLVVPEPAFLPVDHWSALADFARAGGKFVMIGTDPLAGRVSLCDGRFQTRADLKSGLVESAQEAPGVSAVQVWRHMNESGRMRGAVRVAHGRRLPWPGVEVDVEGFREWDTVALDEVPPGSLPYGANTLVFHAVGDERTSRLVVTCEETDGSVWVALVTAAKSWEPHVLHEGEFRYFHGGSGRGGPEDALDLDSVARLSVGLSMHLAPQSAGGHHFGISDVRFARDPATAAEVRHWPDWPLFSPPYRRYATRVAELRPTEGGKPLGSAGLSLQSPLPRSRGMGGRLAPSCRWIPVLEAVGDAGPQGWPASIVVRQTAPGVVEEWGWIGLDPAGEVPALTTAITQCVSRLHQGLFLQKAGCEKFLFAPREELKVYAAWTVPPGTKGVRVVAELRSDEGVSIRRVTSDSVPADPAGGTLRETDVHLGAVPVLSGEARDYLVRVTLEDTGSAGALHDEIVQPIKVVAADAGGQDRPGLSVSGSQFILQKRPLFLLGVNYWPLNATGRDERENHGHWLEPGAFDPLIVRADLQRLKAAGVNALAIQYHEESQAPQLRYFLEEARRNDLWICLYLPHVSPLAYDREQAERLITAASLAQDPLVFAFDLAWEPHLGGYEGRARLDAAWEEWVREQYGSVGHAEDVLGCALWRKGLRLTAPPDEDLTRDGDRRAAVLAYRRFVDDYISRRYGHVRRFLADLGCRQLLTARTGYGGTGQHWPDRFFPLDPASGACHLDFISPEGWGLAGPIEDFHEAAFITAYARGVGGGKPVVWIEFGSSVGPEPGPVQLQNQQRVYESMFELVHGSSAAGCFAWWYPGGFRVDEKSDMGIVHPDGTWRPVRDAYRQYVRRLMSASRHSLPWKGRMIDREADARGLSGLWDAWRATYRQEAAAGRVEEVRPAAYRVNTTELEPAAGPGGRPHADPSPMAHVNAEWGRLEINGRARLRLPGGSLHVTVGDRLRLELINTGAATLAASKEGQGRTAWVRATCAERKEMLLSLGGVPPGGRLWVEWMAPAAGKWTVRPHLLDVGGFGEPLVVEVWPEAR